MRVLLLPSYFLPEGVSSPYISWNRNKAFVDEGWDIVVYTPIPCRGISENLRKEYKSRKYERMLNGKMIIHRFNLIYEKKNPISRAFRYLIQNIKQFNRAVFYKDARSCDIMFVASTPPTQGAMAALVKKFTGKPFVYNLQDIFPDSLVGAGLSQKDSVLWKLGRVIENFTYKHADKIIVISEAFKRNIMAKGVPEDKIEVIYNWVDENAVVHIEKEENPLFEELGIARGAFYVVYAGNLGHAQNVQVLLDAAEILHDEQSVQFLIFGTGGLKSDYERFVKEHNLNNVRFFPLQPVEKVSQVYSLADASLVSCKKGLGGSAMPSKTWSIMSAATPVLCSFDKGGDLQHIIEDSQAGLFSNAGDPNALAENIMKFYNDRNMCRQYGLNGRKFIEANLTKEVGTSKYVEVIKQFDKHKES